MIGSVSAVSYTGTVTPASGTYRFGGGASALTLSRANTLTGANSLVVGALGSTGTVAITGSNNFTGGATLVSGALSISNSAALSTGTINIQGGTVLTSAAVTLANTVNVLGNSTISMPVSNGGPITLNGPLALAATTTLAITGGSNMTINGLISGNGNINASTGGAYSLTITGNNSGYSGTTNITSLNLLLGNDNALGTGLLTVAIQNSGAITAIRSMDVNSRTIATPVTITAAGSSGSSKLVFGSATTGAQTFTGTVTLGVSGITLESDNTTELSGVLTGTNGFLLVNGPGMLVLSGSNSYTGVTNLLGGTLGVRSLNNAGAAGTLGNTTSAGANLLLNGGTLKYLGAGDTTNRSFTFGFGAGTNGANGNGATLDSSGSGAVVFSNTLIAGITVSQSLQVAIASGTNVIAVQDGSRFAAGMSFNGGTLPANTYITSVSGNNVTINGTTTAAVAQYTAVTAVGGPALLTLTGTNLGDNMIQGVIANPTAANGAQADATFTTVVKSGSGKWILSGTNTYTGATLVNGGTLAVNGMLSASSTVTVANGATLGGSGTAAGAVIINAGGTLAPGNSINTFNTGALTVNGNYNPEIGTAGSPYGLADLDIVNGDVTLGAASNLNLINNAEANGQGSAGAGAYKLISFSGNRTGTFATVSNPMSATLHENVVYNDVAKTVDVNLYRLAVVGGLVSGHDFGNWLVSSTAVTAEQVVSNAAANDGFSENLNVIAGTVNNISFSSVSGVSGLSTGTMTITMDRSTSGLKGGDTTVGYNSDGTGLNKYGLTGLGSNPITVAGAVYDAALLTTNTAGTLDHNGTLLITNTSGAYRSLAQISAINTAGLGGWGFGGLTNSDTIAAGDTSTAGYVLAPTSTGLLNGTVQSGSLGITFQNNQNLYGAVGGDLGTQTWALRHTVSGNVAAVGAAQTTTLVYGQTLVGFNAGTGRGGAVLGTTASFLEGTSTGGAASMTFRTRTGGVESATLFSDVVDLTSATGTGAFVLQLSYNPADLGTVSAANLSLGWNNGSAWVNALTGNTGSPITFITATSDYATWRAANPGDLNGFLNVYGVDSVNNNVWAVIDHNSEFAVMTVPEPAALALFALGGLALLRRRRGESV